jgi:HAD superfamily 5'-nucleotidase-like hydrolase
MDMAERGIYCNRTLNLRSIRAIGYDMDYTLVHYNVDEWEGQAYAHLQAKLVARGWPVGHLRYDPTRVIRGLVIDTELGNTIKINRFGYVKTAHHGTQELDYQDTRRAYARTIVDLSEPRWRFLNTLFALSEACMLAQVIDMFDDGRIEDPEVHTYRDMYLAVRGALDAAHFEGALKAEIMADPERYVELDERMPMALLDQKMAGKRLVLITNSEWSYTKFMMAYAFDRFLPGDMTWRDLFEVSVVSSRKPVFFTHNEPVYLVADEERGLLEPCRQMERGKVYHGGSARRVEDYLGVSGAHILYVGDHVFTDVHVSKQILRWRTALILRELEIEIGAVRQSVELQREITEKMALKVRLEDEFSEIRLDLQRIREGYGPRSDADPEVLKAELARRREELVALDATIAPLVIRDSTSFNPHWGHLLRAGNDKAHLTRQIEGYADIYTSRVSNFLPYTPFMFFRASRGSLPHDQV